MSLKWNASANFIGLGYTTVIGIIVLPLYLQYLGAEAFGLVGFFIVLQAWMQLFDMGISPLLSRRTAQIRGQNLGYLELKQLLRSLELIILILAVVISLSIAARSTWIANNWLNVTSLDSVKVADSIVLMGAIIGVRFFASLYRSGIQGLEHQVWLNVANIVLMTLKFVGALLLLHFVTRDFRSFFAYQLIIGVFESAVLATMFYRFVHSTDKVGIKFFWSTLKPILPFAGGIAYATVIWVLVTQLDIIGATMSPLLHGYKELEIPAGPGGKYQLDPSALHIWPRGGFMLIALPNPGGDFTLTLFLANEGETSFAALNNKQAATAFFEDYFPDVVALIQDAAHAIVTNPLGFLGTVRCRSWHDDGNVLLLGDAAHAVVPFHGQGMNLAFEDCVVLDRNLDAPDADWQDIFRKYENEQLANANALADMALENYVEMRDTVRDPKFALRKELAFELERRLPDRFIPRYSMVMFHADIPYRVAKDRGEIQQRLLEQLTSDAESIDQIDLDVAVATVVEQLDPINGGKA